MKAAYWLGFPLLVMCSTAAQLCFRWAAIDAAPAEAGVAWLLRLAATPWAYAAIGGYLATFVAWITLLRHAPIGPAFAAAHLEVVAVMAVSVLWFGEVIAPTQWLGALLIVAGIVCLAFAESRRA